MNRSARNFELFSCDPFRCRAQSSTASRRIDEPDGLDAHAEVILAALLIGVGIVRREYLNDEQWRSDYNVRLRVSAQNHEVGNADAIRCDPACAVPC